MKFVKERVNVICQELARLSISQKIKITDMQVKNGCYITPAEADASKEPWTSFEESKSVGRISSAGPILSILPSEMTMILSAMRIMRS